MNDAILYSIIGAVIWAFIIYQIIRNASKSDAIEKHLRSQIRHMRIQALLLAKIAQKAGVDTDEINEILKTDTKRVDFEVAQ